MASLANYVLRLAGFIGLLFIALALGYEVLAFLTASPTISDLVRAWIKANPFFAMLAVLTVGALLGHFFVLC